jgi:beta-glucosidase
MNRGRALVDIMLGDYNPSGRLSITYPKYNQHLSTYDYKWSEVASPNNIDVEFEFGYGLSYTTFQYSNLNVPSTLKWNDQLPITLNVRNSGSRSGDHSVLLYVSDLYRSVTPPNKELKAFTKISLEVGEEKQVEFSLNRTDLSFIGLNLTRQSEPGLFTITVGNLQASFTLLAEP